MRRSRPGDEAIGKADFAAQLSKLKVMRLGEQPVDVFELGETRPSTGQLFRIMGAGIDGVTFFVARDPFVEQVVVYAPAVWAEGCPVPFLYRTNRRATEDEAALEAVKYVLRIEEEERAAHFARIDPLRATKDEVDR